MTLVVRARIEVDKGSAQADLRQASEAVKQVGDANREAATGAAALTAATNTMSSAQREAAQAVRGEAAAQDEATRAKIANTAAAGRQRAAYQQLGFQVQDVFQQFALGINPLVILAQQGGQVTSALALMGDTQQGTQSKFTRFMTFLSGPWGAAILGAVTIGGLLAQTLWDNEDAATGATQANDAYASAQSQLAKVMNLTTGEMTSQNVVLREQIRLLARKQILEGRKAEREADEALGEVGRPGLFTLFGANDRDRAAFEASTRPVRQLVEDLRKGKIEVEDFRKSIERLEKQGRLTDQEAVDVEEQGLNLAIAKGDQLVGQQMLDALDGKGLAAGLRRDPPKGRTPRKDTSGDRAAREAQRLLDYTDAAEERVQRINEQFNEQPRLLDQAAKASRELDDIQKDVEKRLKDQPDKVKELTAAIKDARGAVEDALLRPFREMEEAGDRQLEQMMLVLQGREAEAEALQRIQQFEERNGAMTIEQREAILAQVEAEREINILIEERNRKLSIYLTTIDDARGALEDLLSGGNVGDFLDNLQTSFRRLQSRIITEQIFGPIEREMQDFLNGRVGLRTQSERLAQDLEKPGVASIRLANVMDDAADKIAQAAYRIANPGLVVAGGSDAPEGKLADDGTIVVQADSRNPITDPTAQEYFDKLIDRMIGGISKSLDSALGIKFFAGLQGVLSGALSGYVQAGPVGAALGALKEVKGLPESITKTLGGAFDGAVAGYRNSQIMDALGIGNSKTGATLGGALGAATGIPGGDIIGSIAGGLIGQALKPTKRGSATITSVDGKASSRGNDQERIQASLGLAGSVQQRLRQIAEEFDAEIGSFAVSIGQRGKNFRVDTSGSGKTKTKRGAIDFGQDEEAAVAFALRDAISDGAIKGLSAAIQKALNSNPDVDKAIKEALKVRDVEELLDGIGGKIRKEVRDFDRQADERLRIAREYGFDILEIERINAEERSKLIESILEDRVGALQDLLNDLVFGDLAEGTLSERRQRLLEEISKAEADAAKGVDGAADRLADLNRRLIQLSRDAYGTAGSEYASDRAQAIASAERIIQIENDRIRGTQEAAAETNRQLATANQLSNEQNDILAEINAGIRNLITLDGLNIAGGGGGNAGIDLGAIARSVNLK
ncbi:hypothetical protein [Blastomonas sp.]|uniref:hypothetical protein n=1 Tax=Blastomonas sp. TaxID=1909299 RepID=UPI0017D6F59A|nr:hypothetical protein [Blastomonas sp.]